MEASCPLLTTEMIPMGLETEVGVIMVGTLSMKELVPLVCSVDLWRSFYFFSLS